jgi:O-antigen ligase
MALDKPLFGWGLGTFEYVFPRYQRFYSDYLVNYAHNDYLQLLVETGLAGLAVLVFFFYRFIQSCRVGLDRWQHESLPAAKLAAVIGCVGIFVHSLFDFNMHVLANALVFVTVASIATSSIRTQRVSHHG